VEAAEPANWLFLHVHAAEVMGSGGSGRRRHWGCRA
jgi:hypothetical protein